MYEDREPNFTLPFRPIVSSIGTYNYNLAKYLCSLLKPHIPADYCATDTFTFVQDIQSLSMSRMFMVRFLLVLKVSLLTYPLRGVLTWRSIKFPRAIPTLS